MSKTVDTSTVYEGGWYLIGPQNSFVTYPKTKKNIEFSDLPGASAAPLKITSKNQQSLLLGISFQYQLIEDKIPQLYASFA